MAYSAALPITYRVSLAVESTPLFGQAPLKDALPNNRTRLGKQGWNSRIAYFNVPASFPAKIWGWCICSEMVGMQVPEGQASEELPHVQFDPLLLAGTSRNSISINIVFLIKRQRVPK